MRFSMDKVIPDGYKAMLEMETYIRSTNIPEDIRELIKIRASVLNGCAYCVDMHTEEALDIGIPERKLFAVAVWHESPLFSVEERAALQLTDEITMISANALTEETYENAINVFGREMVANIILQIVIINSWNRIAISSESEYQPKKNRGK